MYTLSENLSQNKKCIYLDVYALLKIISKLNKSITLAFRTLSPTANFCVVCLSYSFYSLLFLHIYMQIYINGYIDSYIAIYVYTHTLFLYIQMHTYKHICTHKAFSGATKIKVADIIHIDPKILQHFLKIEILP